MTTEEQNVMQDFDALTWELISEINSKKTSLFVQKSAYKYPNPKNKIEKIEDLGYKYYVCMFKSSNPNETVEVWSAIFGDPNHWVDKIADMGYNGMLVKKESVSEKAVKKLFKKTLINYGVEEKAIKLALKTL
jgi:hypothetical protein